MSLPCSAPTAPGMGQCSSKLLREEGGGIEGKAGRTRLVVVELLTAHKPILSFFLGFFLLQQHLTMQMRKGRRRTAPATATVMSAHLGTGAMFREQSWIEELKPSKTYRVFLNPFLVLRIKELYFQNCPWNPGQAPCRETVAEDHSPNGYQRHPLLLKQRGTTLQ